MEVCPVGWGRILSLLTATPVTISRVIVSSCNHFNYRMKLFQL
ncbi:hypothetical protein [Salmonella phage PS3-1]|nr:hypothetical protein [Salmonella phage PS3-1]